MTDTRTSQLKDKTTTNDAWLDRLKALECRDSTFPARTPALVFERAQASTIWDVEGRAYTDLCAGFGALALGHNPPELLPVHANRVMHEMPYITHGMGDVYASRAKVELLETLLSILPPHLRRVSLSLSGGQAVETAVKTAMLTTKRRGFIVFEGSYHGVDLGILPLTSRLSFRQPFAGWWAEGAVQRLPYGCSRSHLDAALKALAANGTPCAGILVEPIQGRAGVRMAAPSPTTWLAELRRACDASGSLLIFDEVFVGLGRTGRMSFAAEVPADIICLGKALGGGFPLSACVGSEAAMAGWPESTGEALHTGTFFGHPFACEIAHKTLQEIVAQNLPARALRLGEQVRARLRAFATRHPELVVAVRGEGLMIGLEFHADGFAARLMDALRADGVIALVSGDRGETLSITPALNIEEELLYAAVERIVKLAVH